MMTPGTHTDDDGRQFPGSADGAPPKDAADVSGSGPTIPEGKEAAEVPGVEGTRLGKSLRVLAEAAVEFGTAVGEEGAKTARHVSGVVVDHAKRGIAHGLEWASATSEEKRGFIHKVIEVLPVVGPNAKYATAWKRWHAAKGIQDEAMMQSARKDCLVALSDLGIDIALLGTASAVSGIARAARGILGPAYLARSARVLGAVNVDPVDSVAVEVAKGPRARRLAEFLLDGIQPGTSAADIERKKDELAQGLELIVDPDGTQEKKDETKGAPP